MRLRERFANLDTVKYPQTAYAVVRRYLPAAYAEHLVRTGFRDGRRSRAVWHAILDAADAIAAIGLVMVSANKYGDAGDGVDDETGGECHGNG